MMLLDLQTHLKATRRYGGELDGKPGLLSDGGIMLAMTDGPDTRATKANFQTLANELRVQPAAIEAFWLTESNGVPFVNGRAPILPERHRFSKITKGFFDDRYPLLSDPVWDKTWYPGSQDGRWSVIMQWYRILAKEGWPIDAAFMAVSYGGPQIMGENYAACGFKTPFAMAEAMARDEATQLRAFANFITATGILPLLRNVSSDLKTIEPVVAKYNGKSYKANNYHIKYRTNFIKVGGR
jgi:hypothetical protein